jgi:hypothetical protein
MSCDRRSLGSPPSDGRRTYGFSPELVAGTASPPCARRPPRCTPCCSPPSTAPRFGTMKRCLVVVNSTGRSVLPRPMYLVVTDRRLICSRLSRFRGTPGRRAFAVPLADLRILSYRSGKYGASLRCGIPGRKPILLHWGWAGRKDFTEVEKVLARSGAFAKLDPSYPSAEDFPTAAYRH